MTFDTRPPRCSLVNVVTGESIECLFNPTQLVEKVQVNWNRLAVPGLSHQVLQYQSTGNRELSAVEFYLDRTFAAEQPGDVDIMEFRAFLRALTVPSRRPGRAVTKVLYNIPAEPESLDMQKIVGGLAGNAEVRLLLSMFRS